MASVSYPMTALVCLFVWDSESELKCKYANRQVICIIRSELIVRNQRNNAEAEETRTAVKTTKDCLLLSMTLSIRCKSIHSYQTTTRQHSDLAYTVRNLKRQYQYDFTAFFSSVFLRDVFSVVRSLSGFSFHSLGVPIIEHPLCKLSTGSYHRMENISIFSTCAHLSLIAYIFR